MIVSYDGKPVLPVGLKTIVGLINSSKGDAYLIGGCVRDMIMKQEPHDIDVCTDLVPDEICMLFDRNSIRYTDVGRKFGTIVAHIGDEEYEVTTYRSEQGYSDNRHPEEVKFEKSLEEDVKRRDFTMNALAYDVESGSIIDYCGGIDDINDKVIRCIGDPDERFTEDPLRIMRAMRFAIKYGFSIDEATSKAMREHKDLLSNISKERITDELKKMLTCGKPVRDVFMEYSDIVAQVVPEIEPCIGFDQNNKWHSHTVYEHSLLVTDLCKSDDFAIKLSALLHDIGKPASYSVDKEGWGHFYGHPAKSREICESVIKNRLSLDNEVFKKVLILVNEHDRKISPTEKSVRKFASAYGYDMLEDLFKLQFADATEHVAPEGQEPLIRRLKLKEVRDLAMELKEKEGQLTVKSLKINGNTLSEMGIEKGPVMGKVLNKLLDKVIDGNLENDEESLKKDALRTYKAIKHSIEHEPVKVKMLIGIPASGKSSYAKDSDLYRICPDEIRKKKYGDISVQGDSNEVFKIVRSDISNSLRQGKSFIYDATNTNPKYRKDMCDYIRKIAEKYGYRVEIEGVVFDTPLETCIKRNKERNDRGEPVPENVLKRMYDNLKNTPPMLSDGFDHLEMAGCEMVSDFDVSVLPVMDKDDRSLPVLCDNSDGFQYSK